MGEVLSSWVFGGRGFGFYFGFFRWFSFVFFRISRWFVRVFLIVFLLSLKIFILRDE